MSTIFYVIRSNADQRALAHEGVDGMHWGDRQYQRKDKSLTPKGKAHYAKLRKERENLSREAGLKLLEDTFGEDCKIALNDTIKYSYVNKNGETKYVTSSVSSFLKDGNIIPEDDGKSSVKIDKVSDSTGTVTYDSAGASADTNKLVKREIKLAKREMDKTDPDIKNAKREMDKIDTNQLNDSISKLLVKREMDKSDTKSKNAKMIP